MDNLHVNGPVSFLKDIFVNVPAHSRKILVLTVSIINSQRGIQMGGSFLIFLFSYFIYYSDIKNMSYDILRHKKCLMV